MKKCPYCGGEYPDDTTACPIDRTPFEPTPLVSETPPRKFPVFALVSENKIPVSLAIVSYIFFIPAAFCFIAFVADFLAIFVMTNRQMIADDLLASVVIGLFGLFWLFLSRGLRRCSRGWHTCALIIIWMGIIWAAFAILDFFLKQQTPPHESIRWFILINVVSLLIQIWQYRVLTRPDIRELFYGKPNDSAHFQ